MARASARLAFGEYRWRYLEAAHSRTTLEDLCSIKKDRLMKTDWNLVRAMMQAAIDTCEQVETLGTGNRIGPPRSRLQATSFRL